MRAINLLPRDDTRRTRTGPPSGVVIGAVVGAVVVTAVLAGGFLLESGKVAEKQRVLTDKQDELNAIPTPPPAATQTEDALVADKTARISALNSALARRVAWDRVLREIALVLPDDVWLDKLTGQAPLSSSVGSSAAPAPAATTGPTAIAASNQVSIEGFTYSQAAVARLLTRLAVIPDLVGVQLQRSGRVKQPGPVVYSFLINANVRQAGASTGTGAGGSGS